MKTLNPENDLKSSFTRPGINPGTLEAAGIRHVDTATAKGLCGTHESGLWIPYRDRLGNPVVDGGREYGRLRLDEPHGGKKYHQQAGTAVHAYLPPGLRDAEPALVIVEGEFKSLSLMEAGFPAVGVSGFYGWGVADDSGTWEPVKQLRDVLEALRPSEILFLGDADTALNWQFSDAAAKLAKAIPVPVRLPRIRLSAPGKGIDDIREILGDGFDGYFRDLIEAAIPVTRQTTPGAIAANLLKHVADDLAGGNFGGFDADKAESRIVEIGAHTIKGDPINFSRIYQHGAKSMGIGKGDFKEACKRCSPVNEALADSLVELYAFDGRTYFKRRGEAFEKLCREDILLDLEAAGFPRRGEGMTPAERVLHGIQEGRRVDYAGKLCGRPAGYHFENGRRLLVTRGPTIPEGDATIDATPLLKFFGDLLGMNRDEHGETQFGLFMAWLRYARIALQRPEQHLPGHFLGLIGPADCGKSLAQALITLCLSGRDADCASWMQGNQFNGGMWEAEHLTISDSDLEEDPRQRKKFRDRIKEAIANPIFPVHSKFKESFSLRPIWRITLSANPDVQSANLIPNPVADASLADKLIYLHCHAPPEPYHGDEPDDRRKFWEGLTNAIPGFVREVDSFEIDPDWRKGRFGVREFVHPAIVDVLEAGNPDRELGELLEDFLADKGPFDGRISDLFNRLEDFTDGGIKRIAKNALVLGHALRRLEAHPDWRDRMNHGRQRNEKTGDVQRLWQIR